MDDSGPISNLSQKYFIDQLSRSNQFLKEVLMRLQSTLIEAMPHEKTKIEEVIALHHNSFNSCLPLVNRNSNVQMRENGQECKEGLYAVSINENAGIKTLEECCRTIMAIPEDSRLVEIRKYESELDCFCTIPKIAHPIETIQHGSKYELVFESKDPIKSANGTLSNKLTKVADHKSSYRGEPAPSDKIVFEPTSSYSVENELLSKLFSRSNDTNTFPTPTPSINSPLNWANRDVESVRLLPEFDPIEIFTCTSEGNSILEHLKLNKMDRNSKTRITFTQILGKFFLEEIRPKLDIPPSASLRRAFIDKTFSCLERIVKPLPPQNLFSNRQGKGYLDVYLKHQNTKSRRIPTRSRSIEVEDFAQNLIIQLDQPYLHLDSNESSNID